MSAVRVKQAHPSPTVAEQNEVLSQEAHCLGQIGQLSGLPEATKQLAGSCARANLGQLGVVQRHRAPVAR
jgi:hypothetical protein